MRSILPHHLLSIISFLLNNVVEHLQTYSSDNGNTNPALELLRRGQQSLHDQIYHEMSTEEQLSLAYIIYSLNESLIACQGSQEQLQSSPALATLVALLLSLCHSSQDSELEPIVSQDIVTLVASAFTSVIIQHGVVLMQNPIVMETLYTVNKCLSRDNIVSHFLQSSESVTVLKEAITVKKSVAMLEKKSILTSELEGLVKMLVPSHKPVLTHLSKEFKAVSGESRDGYKLLNDMDTDTILLVGTDAELKSIDSASILTSIPEVNEKSSEIEQPHTFDGMISKSPYDFKEFPIVIDKNVRVPSNMAVECPDNEIAQCNVSHPSNPSTPWCWKRQIQCVSVANVLHYIDTVRLESLEEVDTECHETICHAIVSVFKPDSAISLVCALYKRSTKVFQHRDSLGNTPLHNAVSTGKVEIVRAVLGLCPCSLSIQNNDYATPLDLLNKNPPMMMNCLMHRDSSGGTMHRKSPVERSVVKTLLVQGREKDIPMRMSVIPRSKQEAERWCWDVMSHFVVHQRRPDYLCFTSPCSFRVPMLRDSYTDIMLLLLSPYFPTYSCSSLHDIRILKTVCSHLPVTVLPHCLQQPCKVAVQRETFHCTLLSGYKHRDEISHAILYQRKPELRYCKYPDVRRLGTCTVPMLSNNYTDVMLLHLSPYFPTYSCSSLYDTRILKSMCSSQSVTVLPHCVQQPCKLAVQRETSQTMSVSWCLGAMSHIVVYQRMRVLYMYPDTKCFFSPSSFRASILSKNHTDLMLLLLSPYFPTYYCSSLYNTRLFSSVTLLDKHTPEKFDKDAFKSWILVMVYGAGYNCLRDITHPQWHVIFGFVPMRGVTLTKHQSRRAKVVLDVTESFHKILSKDILENLNDLHKLVYGGSSVYVCGDIVSCDLRRGQKAKSAKKDRPRSKGADVKLPHRVDSDNCTGTPTSGAEGKAKPRPSENSAGVIHKSSDKRSLSDVVSGDEYIDYAKDRNLLHNEAHFSHRQKSFFRPSSSVKEHQKERPGASRTQSPTQEVSSDVSVLGFTILTCVITVPASDAFGPKRIYPPIKDIKDDPRHGEFNSVKSLAKERNKEFVSVYQESHQKMYHRPISPEFSEENGFAGVMKHDNTTPTPTSQHSIMSPMPTNSPNPLFIPDDHKERLRSTAELLHAQDYARILHLSYDGQPPEYLPPETKIPYVFITGLAYYKMSSHKKSVQYFHQCLGLAEQCERDGDVTICNLYIGDIDFAQRKYTEAAGRYQTALHFYSRDSVAKDFHMILPTKSAVWSKCGAAFKNATRMGDTVSAYEQAIEIALSRKNRLSAHTSLGNLFQGIGENDRVVKEYEEAIELAKELDDDVSLGWNHGNLGNALLGLHQRDKALHHLFKALDMAVDYETTPTTIGRAYNNHGTAFQSLSELVKAEEYYDLALAQAIYGNDISGQARVYGNIGNLQMLNKQYDRAVLHYTEVMRLSNDRATVTTAHHNRGCAYYDWAEKKKNAVVWASNKTGTGFKVSLHGPDFEQCEEAYRPLIVPESVQKYYLQGTRDLDYVIKRHEETFSGIKGSPKGLSLSVSLFETNNCTFHRMQDYLIHLQKSEDESKFEEALLVAEQSRARTLEELLLRRRNPQLRHEPVSPSTSTLQLKEIVKRQNYPVVCMSYTGERLLGWLLYPSSGRCSINMFEVPLGNNEFDGKSFDYHLKYSLNEQLVEKSFEVYKPFDRKKDKTEPVEKLYDLVARPVMTMLETLLKYHLSNAQQPTCAPICAERKKAQKRRKRELAEKRLLRYCKSSSDSDCSTRSHPKKRYTRPIYNSDESDSETSEGSVSSNNEHNAVLQSSECSESFTVSKLGMLISPSVVVAIHSVHPCGHQMVDSELSTDSQQYSPNHSPKKQENVKNAPEKYPLKKSNDCLSDYKNYSIETDNESADVHSDYNSTTQSRPQESVSTDQPIMVFSSKPMSHFHFLDFFAAVKSASQADVFVCIYYSQRKFYVEIIPNAIQSMATNDNICEIVGQKLYELCDLQANGIQEVVVVIDNIANLLLNRSLISSLQAQWNDHFRFGVIIYPPGVAEPEAPLIAELPTGASNCIVGNTSHMLSNDAKWYYPDLPHATKEVEFIAHMLKSSPLLHEDATKGAVLNRMQIATIIHLAAHSSDEGYIALFYTSQGSFGIRNFLTPNDIRELSFQEPPVLVVLSSCSSAKTKHVEGGIEGIATAFLEAGAQAVISTTSRVLDESSCIFMQFFYQYLVDGMMGTVALHKAMQSMRCIPEFADPDHWSNYQYTGKEVRFTLQSSLGPQLSIHLGPSSIFPRLEYVKVLEGALLNQNPPTNVQVHTYFTQL